MKSVQLKANVLSLLILVLFLSIWFVSTLSPSSNNGGNAADSGLANMTPEQIEYQKLMGKDLGAQKSTGFPTPVQMFKAVVKQLSDPFYDNGPNDKGVVLQLGYSLLRVGLGFFLASIIAIPLGFMIGTSPLLFKALDPFIQIL